MIVVDASVFSKLYLDEPDRPKAQALFRGAIENDFPVLAPQLLLYEVLATALHYRVPFDVVYDLLSSQRAAGFRLIEPTLTVFRRAHDIAATGTRKSGYPSLEDSIYHALALELDATFVTADKRHVAKTRSFGGVELLDDWSR